MRTAIDDIALDTLFRAARSYNRWAPEPVSDTTLQALYDVLKFGPTSANSSPARFVFVKSAVAKARLLECVAKNNYVKVEQAPVVAIIGMDLKFYEQIPHLFPHNPGAREWFANDAENARTTAFRNSSLQGAYLIIAARALGLDCGPMSGFDNAKVDAAFFTDTPIKSNFICALGHGTQEQLYPRNPRLSFAAACRIE
jgi:3-hydroxypropanoate dehydrogenase